MGCSRGPCCGGPGHGVGEGRISPAVEGKPLKFPESLICQAWCKCFKYRVSFNVLRNSGGLNYCLPLHMGKPRHRISDGIKLSDSKSHCFEPI